MQKPGVAIQIDGVSKTFFTPGKIHFPGPPSFKLRIEKPKKTKALNGVTLEVKKGSVHGFLGPNGAGKTTLIKTIVGLVVPDHGKVSLFDNKGQVHSSFSTSAKRFFGYLPERPYYHEFLTAEEFLHFHGRLYAIDEGDLRKQIPALLKKVGLKDVRDQKLRTFSKGMLQRIGVAQALLCDPEILIFDEPMSGLDPFGRREVRDLILEIAAAGKTVFFSTHIVNDVEVICNEVTFIRDGKLAGTGVIDELLGKTARSMEIRYAFPDAADPLKIGVLKDSKKTMDGWVIEIESDSNRLEYDVQEALHRILGAKGVIKSVVPRKSNLEDFFIAKNTE